MKKMKQVVSVIMSAALMVGSFSTMAYADEPVPDGWVLNDGYWYLYKNGNLLTNTITTQDGVYYLKEDGKMALGELLNLHYDEENDKVVIAEEGIYPEDEIVTVYAGSSGNLSKGWRMLDDDDQGNYYPSYDEDKANWYFFGLDKTDEYSDEEEDFEGPLMWDDFEIYQYAMVKDAKISEGGKYYLDENGIMAREYWEEYLKHRKENGQEIEWTEYKYYTFFGNQARNNNTKNKKVALCTVEPLPGDEEGQWYRFDSKGVATASDAIEAEMANIIAVKYIGDKKDIDDEIDDNNITIEVGQSTTFMFEVELATPSDAEELKPVFDERYHDIYVARDLSVAKDDQNGLLTKNTKTGPLKYDGNQISFSYESVTPGEVTFELIIDGKAAEITVSNIIPNDDKVEGTKVFGNATLDNIQGSGMEVNCVDNIKVLITDETIDKKALADVWNQSSSARSSEDSNKQKVANIESAYSMEKGILVEATEVDESLAGVFGSAPSMIGAALNMNGSGEINLVVDDVETPTTLTNDSNYSKKTSVDISVNGLDSELILPVIIDTPIPEGYNADNLEVYHILDDGTQEKLNISVKDGNVSFAVTSFSEFIFVETDGSNSGEGEGEADNNNQNSTNNNNTNNYVDSYTSSSSSTSSSSKPVEDKGVTTTDEKKGFVNSLTGIVTGEGDGYSKWVEEKAENGAVLWKFQYADGTMVVGKAAVKEDGTTYEQPAWEMINGKWFAFGADGYADAGWVYDTELGGWFFIDINEGMKVGWQQIGGLWYYLQPVSDGKKGIMYANRWIDGWYVDVNGAWDGKAQAR